MAEVKEHPILTRAKLTQMVRHALKSDNVEMVECDVGLAAPKGEGYSSEVNKLDMTVKVRYKIYQSQTEFQEWNFCHPQTEIFLKTSSQCVQLDQSDCLHLSAYEV